MRDIFTKQLKNRFKSFVSETVLATHDRSFAWRYGAALVCVIISFGIRYLLTPVLAYYAPFILFVPAILVTAWLGGLGPAVLATASALLLTNYFFIAPGMRWIPPDLSQVVALIVYTFSALVVVALANRIRRERERLAAKAEESLQRMKLLQEEMDRRRTVEDRLQAILESSPAMIFLKDVEGRYLLSNRRFEAITHKPAAQIIGESDREIFPPAQAEMFRSNDLKVIETALPSEFEEIALHDDGPHISIVHKFPLRDLSGNIYAIGGIATDITERKRAEEALRKAEQGYADLVASIDGIVWESEPDSLNFSFVSQKAERLLQYPVERWREENFWVDHLHPDDREWALKFCHEATRARRNHDFSYRFMAADGRIVWLRDIVNVVVGRDGAVTLRGIMVDITEQKQSEKALRESEEKYRSLYKNTPVMMHSIDRTGRIISVSHLWLSALGYTKDEVLGRKSIDFLTPESQKHANEVILPQFFRTGFCEDVPYEMVKKNGEKMDVLLSAIAEKDPEGNVIRSLAVSIDVTARNRAERALRASETKLRVLAETAADAIVSADQSGNIIQFNPAAERIFGYSLAEILGKPLATLVPTKFRRIYSVGFENYLATGRVRLMGKTSELVGRRKDGTDFPIEISLSTWSTTEGKFFTGILRDITERKQAEENLRQSEEMLRMTTEGAGIGLWSWDVARDSLNWNPIEYQLSALPPNKAMNLQAFLNVVHPEDRDRVRCSMESAFKENRSLDMEYRIVWPDRTIRWRHCKGSVFACNGRPVHLCGMSLDITESKQAQLALQEARNALALHAEQLEQRVSSRTQQLQRSLKDMESFCYTIAHDLRAPLRAMSGFSQSLAEDYGSQLDEIGHDYCGRINAAANRMAQLISDLLIYGRLTHSELPAQSINLEAEINTVLGRNAPQIEERDTEVKVDKPLPHVCGDGPVFDQILENLILNAIKFVPPERKPRLHIYARQHDGNVRLCIEDNGIGIPLEHQEKIFHPFERLHTGYPGTGIGLAIVQRGVEKMGGQVGVESFPGTGSRFWVELPERCGQLA